MMGGNQMKKFINIAFVAVLTTLMIIGLTGCDIADIKNEEDLKQVIEAINNGSINIDEDLKNDDIKEYVETYIENNNDSSLNQETGVDKIFADINTSDEPIKKLEFKNDDSMIMKTFKHKEHSFDAPYVLYWTDTSLMNGKYKGHGIEPLVDYGYTYDWVLTSNDLPRMEFWIYLNYYQKDDKKIDQYKENIDKVTDMLLYGGRKVDSIRVNGGDGWTGAYTDVVVDSSHDEEFYYSTLRQTCINAIVDDDNEFKIRVECHYAGDEEKDEIDKKILSVLRDIYSIYGLEKEFDSVLSSEAVDWPTLQAKLENV